MDHARVTLGVEGARLLGSLERKRRGTALDRAHLQRLAAQAGPAEIRRITAIYARWGNAPARPARRVPGRPAVAKSLPAGVTATVGRRPGRKGRR